MAKTNRPIKVAVHPALLNDPAIEDLVIKQNEVIPFPPDMEDADMIIAPNAWRIVPELTNLIPLAIKAARKARYGDKQHRSTKR